MNILEDEDQPFISSGIDEEEKQENLKVTPIKIDITIPSTISPSFLYIYLIAYKSFDCEYARLMSKLTFYYIKGSSTMVKFT